MVLESTIVCVDTSEYMRNGDFVPTRIQAQQDAVNLVCLSKTRSNPENTVGLITLSEVKCLVTMTSDVGRILARLHQVHPNGKLNFITGIRVAHLALKHRQGKNHRMRIVAFVGSPVENDEKELVKMAKKLKKEKVSVDLINFGEDNLNTDKLTAFVNTINGSEGTGSHLVTIPPGTLLSDALMNSPIIVGEDGSGAVPGLPGASGGDFEFGFDPSTDPELAMALRISMEEQRQRQEDDTKKPGDATEDSTPKPISQPADSEEALLEQALVMSNQPMSFEDTPTPDLGAMTEEEQITYALQMSMRQTVVADLPSSSAETPSQEPTPMETDTPAPAAGSAASKPDDADDFSEVMNDPEFLQSVLRNLPGVDPTSEDVQRAMGNLTSQPKDSDKKDDKGGQKK